ncbi:hypothetical protein HY994_06170 [Candidatus Micrarchaeota archaeon]|nr:hypothetical protein [Candidatus Micrarchaeota archaeon]
MVEKRVRVILVGNAKTEYLALQKTVETENQKGVTSSLHQTLLRSIESKIGLLKTDYGYGTQIPKKLIPQKYAKEFGVTNLWKVDLSGYWRLIYTLKQPQRDQTEIEIIEVWLDVLDILDHPTYDKTFGYKKRR